MTMSTVTKPAGIKDLTTQEIEEHGQKLCKAVSEQMAFNDYIDDDEYNKDCAKFEKKLIKLIQGFTAQVYEI
jgi:hypothetical protein